MKIYHQTKEMEAVITTFKSSRKTVGFIPTMGALHDGHLSLVRQAQAQNDVVIVSVFVNPTQFNNADDLLKYPRTLDRDVELLRTLNDDIIVFAPSVDDVYGRTVSSTSFDFGGLEHEMEGKYRKGHFDGVGTIIHKLFAIIRPTRAYFGKKDFQQLRIIEKLVDINDLNVEIIGCDIHRAADGLAMSSRNERLKPAHRDAAPFIYKTLKAAKVQFGTKSADEVIEWVENQFANHDLLTLEYFIIADEETLKTTKKKINSKTYRAFIAVFADDIRLIDNIALN